GEVARGEVELAEQHELELARAVANADVALTVDVAHLEPHGELGHDRVQRRAELPVDVIDERDAPGWVFAGARGDDAALGARLIAPAQRGVDRRREAFPEAARRDETTGHLDGVLLRLVLGAPGRIVPGARGDLADVAGAESVREADGEVEGDGALVAGPLLAGGRAEDTRPGALAIADGEGAVVDDRSQGAGPRQLRPGE